MLGKQRKNNVTDQQFMDAAWKNMAEILDQEMPVERKERRIGWISIAALLVMGFVGGISVMWGLQKHQPSPMAFDQKTTTTPEANIVSAPMVEENKIITKLSQQKGNQTLTSNSLAHNSNITPHSSVITTTNNNQISIAATSNTEQILGKDLLDTEAYSVPVNLSESQAVKNAATILTASQSGLENSTANSKIVMDDIIEKIDNHVIPLNELPTLGLRTLPTSTTNLSIDPDLDLPKNKKWNTGIYAGAVVAGKTGNGLEAAFRVQRKLGAKWAVETGLGFRATQLAFLSENQPVESLVLGDASSPELGLGIVNPDGDTIVNSIAATQEIANIVNANEPNYQLTLPLSLIYRPTGKLRLALGMSWAYRLNKLKDASSFSDDLAFAEFSRNSGLDQNSFSDRLNDIRLNFGIGYYLNPRTAIELAFSEALSFDSVGGAGDLDNNATSLTKSENDLPSRFLQIGLTHYFGK